MSRPSDYTEELASKICELIADGKSLRSICQDEEMPSKSTVFSWLADQRYSSFRTKYALAREAQADTLFDEMLDIADDGSNDWMEKNFGEETRWVENGEAMRRSDIRIKTRQWMAAKMRPKVYGDRLDLDVKGNVGFVVGARPITEEQWLEEHGSGDKA
ncbi:terminase small subunit protein [Rhizobium grahamii]|uniref:Terminase small subunit protein n=1 Tax=Rhizobium grahamii TaxID=1120045 RepID=A0A370KRL4_9HYPH|nr:terminase small subunit protein [Rhizobium grahamii]RDJ12427.1 terminase small subunit protein [Rhizobium grahamii]